MGNKCTHMNVHDLVKNDFDDWLLFVEGVHISGVLYSFLFYVNLLLTVGTGNYDILNNYWFHLSNCGYT